MIISNKHKIFNLIKIEFVLDLFMFVCMVNVITNANYAEIMFRNRPIWS